MFYANKKMFSRRLALKSNNPKTKINTFSSVFLYSPNPLYKLFSIETKDHIQGKYLDYIKSEKYQDKHKANEVREQFISQIDDISTISTQQFTQFVNTEQYSSNDQELQQDYERFKES